MPGASEIGRASCRERVEMLAAAVALEKLPGLVTVKVYGITWPAAVTPVVVDALTIVSAGDCTTEMMTGFADVSGSGGALEGGVPVTVAVLTIGWPLSRSAAVAV